MNDEPLETIIKNNYQKIVSINDEFEKNNEVKKKSRVVSFLSSLFSEYIEEEEKTLILDRKELLFYLIPLKNFFGVMELSKWIVEDCENDIPEDREIGDATLIENLYEIAIDQISKKGRIEEVSKILEKMN